jgi:hypothetical protein
MKKVKDVLPLLQSAIRDLGPVDAPCPPSGISAWIDAISFLQIRLADDACRTFATSLFWPVMSDEVRAQVHCRLSLAERFARSMSRRALPNESGVRTLEFLLIELWHNCPHS